MQPTTVPTLPNALTRFASPGQRRRLRSSSTTPSSSYNFVSSEGPGQPSVRRAPQGKSFIADWGRVIIPVMDWLYENAGELSIDTKKIALFGESMGGYLAACFAVDGILSGGKPYTRQLPPVLKSIHESGDEEKFDAAANAMVRGGALTTIK